MSEAGSVLAALHDALAAYPRPAMAGSCSEASIQASIPCDPGLATGPGAGGRLTQWLDSVAPSSSATAVAFVRDRLLSLDEASLPRPQMVHNDIRSANILCRGSMVSALLDFEEVTVDYRVSEVAKATVMLGTRFHHWAPLDPEMQRCFVAGYREVHSLSPSEEAWLPVLAVYRTLRLAPRDADPAGWAVAAERLAARRQPF